MSGYILHRIRGKLHSRRQCLESKIRWHRQYVRFVSVIAQTWAERGHVQILYGSEKRTFETDADFITLTPHSPLSFHYFPPYSPE